MASWTMSFVLCLVACLAFMDHVMTRTQWPCRTCEINICRQTNPEDYIGCFKWKPFDCKFICEYESVSTLDNHTPDGEFCYVDNQQGKCKNGDCVCTPNYGEYEESG